MLRKLLWFVVALLLLAGGVLGSFYRPDIPKDQMRERWADETSRFLEVLGTEVHLKDEAPSDGLANDDGEAPADLKTLVLIHGTASSLAGFGSQRWRDRSNATMRYSV